MPGRTIPIPAFDATGLRLALRLVCYGPALGGKPDNLISLHEQLQPELRGEMVVLETRNDRTVFFGLLPEAMTIPCGLLAMVKRLCCRGRAATIARCRTSARRWGHVGAMPPSRTPP